MSCGCATVAIVAASVAVAGCGSGRPASLGALSGYVNDKFEIGVTENATVVKSLEAGTYTLVVHDSANIHNFHLTGPGVDEATPVGGQGTYAWSVTLRRGTYTYVCDPHASLMKGSFTVR